MHHNENLESVPNQPWQWLTWRALTVGQLHLHLHGFVSRCRQTLPLMDLFAAEGGPMKIEQSRCAAGLQENA